jgi:hypothetical protein
MPTIGQVARIAHRGRNVPDIRAGDAADAAIAYEGMLGRALAGGKTRPADGQISTAFARRGGSVLQGTPGYEWKGSLNAVVTDAWSELAAGDKEEFDAFGRAVNEYLARTGNAVCIYREKRMGMPSTWWVRAAWNPVAPSVTSQPARGPERKLTAAEAGEDRAPAAVSQTWKCTWPGCRQKPYQSLAFMVRHHLETHRSARSYLAEAIAYAGEPQPGTALADIAVLMGCPAGRSTLARELKIMAETGNAKLVRQAYGPADYPFPEDENRCFEPGCGQSFRDASGRTHHEEREHPDSAARSQPCACGLRFYTHMGTSVHVSHAGKGHAMLPLTCREGCGAEFAYHVARTWHEDNEHPHSGKRTDICPRCAAEFYPSGGDLARHRARLHGWNLKDVPAVSRETGLERHAANHPRLPADLSEPVVPGLSDKEIDDFVTTVTEPAVKLPAAEVLREFLADYDQLRQRAAATPAELAELRELREEVARLRQREETRRALGRQIAESARKLNE